MKPAPAIPPRWGVTVQEEQISTAVLRAEGVSFGENFEQFMGFWLPPEALTKRLLEARIILAQEQIALQQRDCSGEQG